VALQTNGKILIRGQFTVWHGVLRNGFARLTAADTLETAFANT